MNVKLKFVTDIIRPWERLNSELINQNSIDSTISEIITTAEDLSVKLSHFPESVGQKAVRNNKSSHDFNTIVDIADASKHDILLDEKRNNELILSSMFEGKDNETFRFIRNRIIIKHNNYGQSDFLETFKKATQFLFIKLNLNIFWNPNVLEAPNIFIEKVFLNIQYQHQIAWTNLQVEFFRRNEKGELIPYDPPKCLFELRSYQGITAIDYYDYIFQLLQNSIDKDSQISKSIVLPMLETGEIFNTDFIIKENVNGAENTTIVKILSDSCSVELINGFHDILQKTNTQNIILFSKLEFSNEIKEFVSITCRNVFCVTIDNQDAENLPLGFFKVHYKYTNVKMTAIRTASLGVLKVDETLFANLAGKPLSELGDYFSLDKINLMSFNDLCLSHVKPKNNSKTGSVKLKYKPRDQTNIFFKIEETFVKIGFEAEFDWESESMELYMPILTFSEFQTDISIWNLETLYNTSGRINKLSFRVLKYGNTSAVGMI